MSFFFTDSKKNIDFIAQTIRNAGGSVVGRTRLQKTMYILSIAGYEVPFNFEYKHFGPFSDQLADAATVGAAFGKFDEDQKSTNWGGSYFLYSAHGAEEQDKDKVRLTKIAASSDAIALELAATAAYLFLNGYRYDPWEETCRRKPDKVAGGKLASAKAVYDQLKAINSPVQLPQLPE